MCEVEKVVEGAKSSLAGTNKVYLDARISVMLSNGFLELYVDGTEFNTSSGLKVKSNLDELMIPVESFRKVIDLASNDEDLLEAQVRPYPNNLIHVQMPCSEKINRPYGLAFDIQSNEEICDWLASNGASRYLKFGEGGASHEAV